MHLGSDPADQRLLHISRLGSYENVALYDVNVVGFLLDHLQNTPKARL